MEALKQEEKEIIDITQRNKYSILDYLPYKFMVASSNSWFLTCTEHHPSSFAS